MNNSVDPTFDARLATSTLAQELQLVEEAVAAVASGRFPRVTVAGLRFGDEVLPVARILAKRRGLLVVPLTSNDEHGSGLTIETPLKAAQT